MVHKPLVTILTPVYNGEKYIKETIESVLNANINQPYEYIVLDDGSSDSTPQILNAYKSTITVLRHSNSGEARTINRGLEIAKGEFILIINADDPLMTGELIDEATKILSNDPSIVAVYPDWRIIDKSGNTLITKVLPNYSEKMFIGHCRCLPGPGAIFRKDHAIKIGGRRAQFVYVSDYDFWLRLSRVGKIVRLPRVLAQWRENPGSASIRNRGHDLASERLSVTEIFLSENKVPSVLHKMALGNSHYLAARLAFFDPTINGRRLMLKAFKHRKGWPEEARIHVVLYLLFTPLSSAIIKPFTKLIVKLISYR